MFTILGGDGKEYGPASITQVRAWINAGRANLDTRAKLAGDTEWRRLGDIPEFAGSPAADVPPALDGTADSTLVPADRGIRLLAAILDTLMSAVCALPGGLILGVSFVHAMVAVSRGQQPDFTGMDAGRLLLGFSLLGLATFSLLLVQIFLVSTRGQTIGKIIVGIRIVRVLDGSNPGFVHGWLLRALVPGLIGVLGIIGNIFTLVNYCFIFRDDRRCLHDLIAGTRVVKK